MMIQSQLMKLRDKLKNEIHGYIHSHPSLSDLEEKARDEIVDFLKQLIEDHVK